MRRHNNFFGWLNRAAVTAEEFTSLSSHFRKRLAVLRTLACCLLVERVLIDLKEFLCARL